MEGWRVVAAWLAGGLCMSALHEISSSPQSCDPEMRLVLTQLLHVRVEGDTSDGVSVALEVALK